MKKVLLVIDYQKDFVDGALGFEGAELLEQRIIDKIEQYAAEGHKVIFTLDTHEENYMDTAEGKALPVPHCINGTEGWGLYGKLPKHVPAGSPMICKETFGSLSLANYLAQEKFDSVELVGLVSNICVLSNAVLAKAALPESKIIVDASCTSGADKEMHEKSLDIMQGIFIDVINR